MNVRTPKLPWYREPWPWLVMAGPAVVVIASLYTAVLAVRSSDGLVADDYYTEGLIINRSLARDAAAAARGLHAAAQFGNGRVQVSLQSQSGAAPRALRLQLLHPTRDGLDQDIVLHETAPGLWEGRLDALAQASWRLELDAPEAGWRLTGIWHNSQGGGQGTVQLLPAVVEPRP